MVKSRKILEEYETYTPGKSKKEISKNYNIPENKIIKLGSNENPIGPSPKAKEAMINALDQMNRYPESNHELIREKIAKYANVRKDQVIVGGDGADEIIDVLAKTFMDPQDEFIVHSPTYMYYEYLFKAYDTVPVYAKWNIKENRLDLDSVLNKINDKTKVIFLCTPNNPTGGLISQDDIRKVLESTDALVVVDEAYWEFSEVNNVNLLEEYDNLFILRTFSKVMGLAGLRIGYGLSSSQIIEKMNRIKPVFSLTVPSQAAVLATIDDTDFIKKSTEYGIQEREYIYESINKFKNIHIYKSKSNYLLLDIRKTGFTANELAKKLMENGIIVRDCTSFRGLDEYYIRVSIATHPENEKFIKILKELTE